MNDNIDYCHHDSKTLNTNYYQVLNGGRSSGKTFQTINMYEQKYKQLQSNWNSLRECIQDMIYTIEPKGIGINYNCEYDSEEDFIEAMKEQSKLNTLKFILDKMNELEGVDNENNRFIK